MRGGSGYAWQVEWVSWRAARTHKQENPAERREGAQGCDDTSDTVVTRSPSLVGTRWVIGCGGEGMGKGKGKDQVARAMRERAKARSAG